MRADEARSLMPRGPDIDKTLDNIFNCIAAEAREGKDTVYIGALTLPDVDDWVASQTKRPTFAGRVADLLVKLGYKVTPHSPSCAPHVRVMRINWSPLG